MRCIFLPPGPTRFYSVPQERDLPGILLIVLGRPLHQLACGNPGSFRVLVSFDSQAVRVSFRKFLASGHRPWPTRAPSGPLRVPVCPRELLLCTRFTPRKGISWIKGLWS